MDVSDDTTLTQKSVIFRRNAGVIPALCTELFNGRKAVKNQLKSMPKDTPQYRRLDAKQLSIKLVLNTCYGLVGSSISPLFWKPMGAAVTAFARQCTTTARDLIVSRGHQFLAADTDSIMAVLGTHVNTYQDIVSEMSAINAAV